MGRPFVAAVDGPAGSGKSSICAKAAARLGYAYLSTGVLYRAVGALAHRAGADLNSDAAMARVVEDFSRFFAWDAMQGRISYKGEDISPLLITANAGTYASCAAKLPSVRQLLLPVQRQMIHAAPKGIIVDGRDICTVVFPDADVKIFMTASLEVRAKRRLAQLKQNGMDAGISLEEIIQDIAERDERDSARGEAPMKRAEGSVLFDNSNLSIEEAIAEMVSIIQSCQK